MISAEERKEEVVKITTSMVKKLGLLVRMI